MILMREDDHDRIDRFTARLPVIVPTSPRIIWRSALRMIREVASSLPSRRTAR